MEIAGLTPIVKDLIYSLALRKERLVRLHLV